MPATACSPTPLRLGASWAEAQGGEVLFCILLCDFVPRFVCLQVVGCLMLLVLPGFSHFLLHSVTSFVSCLSSPLLCLSLSGCV